MRCARPKLSVPSAIVSAMNPLNSEQRETAVPVRTSWPARLRAHSALVLTVVLSIAAAGAIVGAFFWGMAQGGEDAGPAPAARAAHTAPVSAAPTATPAVSVPVTSDDFLIDVTVLKQKCFGSAGCNVTYTIDPTYLGLSSALEGRSFTVIYEITGGKSQEIDSFTVDGTSVSYTKESTTQTPSADAVLAAHITSVRETT